MSREENSQASSLVNAILKLAIDERCPEIHIEKSGTRVAVRFRVNDAFDDRPTPSEQSFDSILARIKTLANLDVAEHRLPQAGQFAVKVQSSAFLIHVASIGIQDGERVVLRLESPAKDSSRA